MAVLAAEDARAPTPQDIAVLIESARGQDPHIQAAAIRALGRLERRDVVTSLVPHLAAEEERIRIEAAFAVAQAMRGEPLPLDARGDQVDGVQSALLSAAGAEKQPRVLGEIARALGRLPYERPEQTARADAMLRSVLTLSRQLSLTRKIPGDAIPALAGAVAGAELLARLHLKIAPPSDEMVRVLRNLLKGTASGVPPSELPPAAHVMQALVAARGLDDEVHRFALASPDDGVRRLAVLALASAGSEIGAAARGDYLRKGMRDPAFHVRFEAVRGYARTAAKTEGCGPLMDMLGDPNVHVVLAVIDALGDACAGDDDAVSRLMGEARTPKAELWQREAHALVALAKLSPAHAAIPLHSHSRHPAWQVRMYAARAAGILNDVETLERLALDGHDNVREATLPALRRLEGDAAEPLFIAALGRSDYQLLRTAALEMKGMKASDELSVALADALRRVTAEKKETSRDTRLAIVERMREFDGPAVQSTLAAHLRDFDPKVATAAAATLSKLTAILPAADPQPLLRQPLPTAPEIAILKNHCAVLEMQTGVNIELALDPDAAPMTATRFLRLANANYFDGLTFHRVVPNFVVQGGSPGANEYAGAGPYLRDEISTQSHVAGTIGLSTRGRDTGDAQLFFNLVHNPRLDYEYTIFGKVSLSSLGRMLDIVEGDTIRDVKWVPCGN